MISVMKQENYMNQWPIHYQQLLQLLINYCFIDFFSQMDFHILQALQAKHKAIKVQ